MCLCVGGLFADDEATEAAMRDLDPLEESMTSEHAAHQEEQQKDDRHREQKRVSAKKQRLVGSTQGTWHTAAAVGGASFPLLSSAHHEAHHHQQRHLLNLPHCSAASSFCHALAADAVGPSADGLSAVSSIAFATATTSKSN